MRLTENTIFITGGGSGIGRGLAEALHRLGNTVIISGRRKGHLDAVLKANPGMQSIELDVADAVSIDAAARRLILQFPRLNVLINNAGIMIGDNAAGTIDDAALVSIVSTNLLGPIRMTSSLIEHLKKQDHAAVINVSSGLAFTPMAMTAIYSATKAALHSYTLSQRFMLRGTDVQVQEIVPPWVQTELMTGSPDPRAMPLDKFIAGTMKALGTDAEEANVEEVKILRNNPGPSEYAFVAQFNDMVSNRGD